ncbi:MAG: hypothetical protein JRN20_14770 [Nitrososphaerota archaeon]|nr:hypothetical protein [Nitrososphaerota archaeon]
MGNSSRIVFFNASLANGHLMSRPVYEPEHALMGELMRSVENESPYAAWMQIIFVSKNYSKHFTYLKHRMAEAIREIETPRVSIFTGKELGDKPAKFKEFYTGAPKRVKKIDESLSKSHVLMGIQGMWISEDDEESRRSAHHLEEILPFSHCHDEIDRLAVYEYSDPRFLLELVDRRIVTDISNYFRSYAGARVEPPSFILSADELSSYVHIPSGQQADKIHSMTWGTASISPRISSIKNGIDTAPEKKVSILQTNELPRWEEGPDESIVARLALLASDTERSFELVYQSGEMSVLLSSKTSEDLSKYRNSLESVYGELKFEQVVDARPEFLKEVPLIVGVA